MVGVLGRCVLKLNLQTVLSETLGVVRDCRVSSILAFAVWIRPSGWHRPLCDERRRLLERFHVYEGASSSFKSS